MIRTQFATLSDVEEDLLTMVERASGSLTYGDAESLMLRIASQLVERAAYGGAVRCGAVMSAELIMIAAKLQRMGHGQRQHDA